jgi:SAM-dependent methyltransferase
VTPPRFTLPQCGARCTTTLVVASPRLWRVLRLPFRRYFDRLAPRWNRIVACERLNVVESALNDVRPPARALDVGTGTGRVAFLVARRFEAAHVVGVDLSPQMVASARAATPEALADRVRFVVGDAARLPVATASCDLVTLVNAIPFFDELARVVAPGGVVLVAFSEGPRTPIWVPPDRLRGGLARRGFSDFVDYAAGGATCLLARLRTRTGRSGR